MTQILGSTNLFLSYSNMLLDFMSCKVMHYDALDADIRIAKAFSFSLIILIEDLDSVFWHLLFI